MLVICPTADYEIYLGKNLLPAEEVLFEPTRKLLDLWGEYDIKSTLFPDICSAWRHRELGMSDYPDTFEAQIQEAARAQHDVQLHLHPEWRFAEHRDGAWFFAPRSGSLHDLGFSTENPQAAPALIRQGREYLEALLRPLNPDYRCIAFRAGGWILQPERELVGVLLSAGIRVDATIIPGLRLLRTDYTVDFRRVPDKPNWYISPTSGLERDSGRPTDLLEVSIASYRGHFPIWQHVANELRLRRRAKARPQKFRGYPIVKVGQKHGPLERIKRKYRKLTIPRMLDIADTCESMLATLTSYLRHYDCRAEEFAVCMNGHPKDTYDHHLDELRRFFDIVASRYSDVVRFETLAGFHTRRTG
ncbi:MAG: hypothetical protein ACE5G2_04235 [Candidatus Krumholzibacteriia bacterium]